MDGPARHHSGIKFDLAKCVLITHYVLLQNGEQRFCLLRTEVNSLKILYLNLGLALLLKSAENQEKIPHIHAYLNAVRIGFPVIRGVNHLDIGLSRNRHKPCSVTQTNHIVLKSIPSRGVTMFRR